MKAGMQCRRVTGCMAAGGEATRLVHTQQSHVMFFHVNTGFSQLSRAVIILHSVLLLHELHPEPGSLILSVLHICTAM